MTLFYGLSRSATKLSPFMPASNFMGLENHLVFWGNAAILTGGVSFGYFLFYNSSAFIPNPNPVVTFSDGWNSKCMSSTIIFLMTTLIYTLIVPFLYRSSPWK